MSWDAASSARHSISNCPSASDTAGSVAAVWDPAASREPTFSAAAPVASAFEDCASEVAEAPVVSGTSALRPQHDSAVAVTVPALLAGCCAALIASCRESAPRCMPSIAAVAATAALSSPASWAGGSLTGRPSRAGIAADSALASWRCGVAVPPGAVLSSSESARSCSGVGSEDCST